MLEEYGSSHDHGGWKLVWGDNIKEAAKVWGMAVVVGT